MPRFTFTSEDEGVTISHSFETDYLAEALSQADRFFESSGFVLPEEEEEEVDDGPRLTQEDFLAKEEDYLWDDAISSKFGNVFKLNSTYLEGK